MEVTRDQHRTALARPKSARAAADRDADHVEADHVEDQAETKECDGGTPLCLDISRCYFRRERAGISQKRGKAKSYIGDRSASIRTRAMTTMASRCQGAVIGLSVKRTKKRGIARASVRSRQATGNVTDCLMAIVVEPSGSCYDWNPRLWLLNDRQCLPKGRDSMRRYSRRPHEGTQEAAERALARRSSSPSGSPLFCRRPGGQMIWPTPQESQRPCQYVLCDLCLVARDRCCPIEIICCFSSLPAPAACGNP